MIQRNGRELDIDIGNRHFVILSQPPKLKGNEKANRYSDH